MALCHAQTNCGKHGTAPAMMQTTPTHHDGDSTSWKSAAPRRPVVSVLTVTALAVAWRDVVRRRAREYALAINALHCTWREREGRGC